jgi:hypothetical protein
MVNVVEYYVLMYENGKMRPVLQEQERGNIGERWRG